MEQESKFKVGDAVFVPNAYEWKWEEYLTKITEVEEVDGKTFYYADVTFHRLTSFQGSVETNNVKFKEEAVFPATKEGKEACSEYISNYYYDGLCRGCKWDSYDGNGTVFKCKMCKHYIYDDPQSKTGRHCELNNIYGLGKHEICRHFDPSSDGIKKQYQSWNKYYSYLKECEFNNDCPHHKESCHTTCTLDYYMNNKMVSVPLKLTLLNREVDYVKMPRKLWVDQTFIDKDIVCCNAVFYKYEKNKKGKPKKECMPIERFFNGTARIDTKKGIVVGFL